MWNQSIVPCPVLTCFLTCIEICQEAGKVVWYSHLFQNFPQFIVIHTVKGFGIVNKAEVDVFLELSFSMIQWMLAIWSLVPLPFLNPIWNIWDFTVHVLLKPDLENFEHHFTSMWNECRIPRFNSWVRKIHWRSEWQPIPVFLPGEFQGKRSLVGCSPWGYKELDMTEQQTLLQLLLTYMTGTLSLISTFIGMVSYNGI